MDKINTMQEQMGNVIRKRYSKKELKTITRD